MALPFAIDALWQQPRTEKTTAKPSRCVATTPPPSSAVHGPLTGSDRRSVVG